MKIPHDLDNISPWHIDFASWFRRKPKISGGDLEYMQDVRAALLAQATPGSSAILYLMVVLTTAALIWASVSRVDEVTQAEARVIPTNREQVINSLEGGVLGALLVREGDVVTAGQPIVQLEPTRYESQYQEGMSKKLSLLAARARARTEATGAQLSFPPEVAKRQLLVDNETQTYRARKRMLDESVSALKRSQELLANEIQISEKLAQQGLFSIVELSRLRRQENELNQQVTERLNKFRAEANAELVRIETELGQLTPNLNARLDTFKRTTLNAPVNGVVKNIRITTIGAAVPPSAPILDIVPGDAKLLFEARLNPKDVSHVKPDLPVAIKMGAYDSAVYGELNGRVIMVSPDTFREDARQVEAQEGGYYRVMIESQLNPEEPKQREMKIIPGMTATAQIKTGNKTIMQYMLKPLSKAKEAFRER
jgi:adhesin transport system membrane fusion protein